MKDLFASRLRQIISDNGHNAHSFAKALNHGRSNTVRNAANGNNLPNISLLFDIAEHFDDVDFHWLITGKGNRPVQPGYAPQYSELLDDPAPANEPNVKYDSQEEKEELITMYEKRIAGIKMQLDSLEKENELLKRSLNKKGRAS